MRLPLLVATVIAALTYFVVVAAEYCGANKIPYGLEVHKNGRLVLLCSRPNCHEKKYADCPERAHSIQCSSNATDALWVGGIERRIDGSIRLMCCEYDLLPKYGEVVFENVTVRRGEFYEGEQKTDDADDVVSFDIITNIRRKQDDRGEAFVLRVTRYHCGRITSTPPAWAQHEHWPYWAT